MAKALVLRLKSGPAKGQFYPLTGRDDLLIGRNNTDILLADPKVSGVHARISNVGNRWILQDNGSKNGIRDSHGQRMDLVKLRAGTQFSIGDTLFEVEEIHDAAEAAGPAERKPKAPPPEKKKSKYWHTILADFLQAHSERFQDRVLALSPLEPALILEFVRGAQVNSKWILGFGPRQIGADSLDLPIWEPGAPGVCFEIHPSPEGLIFKTQYPEKIHLNGHSVESELLRIGDTIKIMDTLIEVDFVE